MTHKELAKKVEWKDLKHLTYKEMIIENILSIPFFVASMALAFFGFYWLALPFSAFFFLTALRQAHNGFHKTLGTQKFLTWLSLYLNSLLMMVSFHAVKFNHLRHHKYCLEDEDHEGRPANMSWYGAILYGPVHFFMFHKITFQKASRYYVRNMFLELFSIVALVAVVLFFNISFLLYHIIAMTVGQFMVAFFAVWAVHHDAHEIPEYARTQRGGWKNALTFNMFYHLEHHLFPAVPTIKLPELARRIDEALPEIEKKQTF